jgi:hypothetical protein
MQQPLGNDDYAAPTFEIFEFETDSPLSEVTALSKEAAELFPELASVHEALRGVSFIL